MLDQAFEALKKYDFGVPISELQAIEDAMVAAHTDPAVRQDLEERLLASWTPRFLATQGLRLPEARRNRFARRRPRSLEAAVEPNSTRSLVRTHWNGFPVRKRPRPSRPPQHNSRQIRKSRATASIGARGETAGVATLAVLLKDADPAAARSAALSLGLIGGAEAAADCSLRCEAEPAIRSR